MDLDVLKRCAVVSTKVTKEIQFYIHMKIIIYAYITCENATFSTTEVRVLTVYAGFSLCMHSKFQTCAYSFRLYA